MCRHAAGGACGNVPILDAMFTELFLIARYNSMLTSNIFIDFGRVERPAGSTRSSRLHRPSPPLWFVYKALHNTESLHIKQTCIRKLYIHSLFFSALYAIPYHVVLCMQSPPHGPCASTVLMTPTARAQVTPISTAHALGPGTSGGKHTKKRSFCMTFVMQNTKRTEC